MLLQPNLQCCNDNTVKQLTWVSKEAGIMKSRNHLDELVSQVGDLQAENTRLKNDLANAATEIDDLHIRLEALQAENRWLSNENMLYRSFG